MTREEFLEMVHAKNEEDRKLAERMQEERMDFLLRYEEEADRRHSEGLAKMLKEVST